MACQILSQGSFPASRAMSLSRPSPTIPSMTTLRPPDPRELDFRLAWAPRRGYLLVPWRTTGGRGEPGAKRSRPGDRMLAHSARPVIARTRGLPDPTLLP